MHILLADGDDRHSAFKRAKAEAGKVRRRLDKHATLRNLDRALAERKRNPTVPAGFDVILLRDDAAELRRETENMAAGGRGSSPASPDGANPESRWSARR